MDFSLTEEQIAFQKMVREWVDRQARTLQGGGDW